MKDRRQILILVAVLAVLVALLLPDLLRHLKITSPSLNPAPAGADLFSDYSSPENALRSLEDAYRRRDIEAAVRSKDFVAEARLMLRKMGKKSGPATSPHSRDDDVVRRTAEVLELSFRKHTTENWPDFHGLKCSVVETESHETDVIVATERCRFPDGEYSTQRVLLSRTDAGWRVLNPLD